MTAELSHILEAYRALFHGHSDAVHLIDTQGFYIEVNEQACRIKGLPRERVLGRHYSEFVAPEEHEQLAGIFQAALRGHPQRLEHSWVDEAGACRYYAVNVMPLLVDGEVHGVYAIAQDISEAKRAQAEIRRLEGRLTVAMEAMTDAFLTIDQEYRYTYLNREAERLLKRSREEMIGRTVWAVFPDLVGTIAEDSFRKAMDEHCPVHYEHFYEPLDFWVEVSVYPGPEGLAVLFRDISERKRTQEEIQFLAFYDPLTGLPNRRLLMDRLQQALAASARHGVRGAVLFLDLDHFKTLNDTLGHTEGDALLRRVAECLKGCVRATDTVARFGGDEYVVVLGDLDPDPEEAMAQAELMARKILTTLTQPGNLAGRERQGTCSIGVTLFGKPGDTVDEIMKQADLAMYQAKASGRNTLRRFDPDMQAAVNMRVRTEAEVRRALEQMEFEPYYQPQVDLDGRLAGAEALVRWHHPQRGVVPPVEFIPVAEDTGLIFSLGHVMLEHVCRQIAAWAVAAGHPDWCVAVNVSARQFHHPDFVQKVFSLIDETGADARQLQLELTESSLLVDMDDTISKMKALKSRGVSFSLDDFGTGYSSLYYLKHLPLDQIKIDQRFVRGVLDDANDAAIVRAIIALARSLGLNVIAEGVEDRRVQSFLANEGCPMFQGYLYSRPVPRDEFERFFLNGQLLNGSGSGG